MIFPAQGVSEQTIYLGGHRVYQKAHILRGSNPVKKLEYAEYASFLCLVSKKTIMYKEIYY